MSEIDASVVVTGTAWIGGGLGSIESALERLCREAISEIDLTVYSISSGADLLLGWVETALARGVQVRMVLNRLDEQPVGAANRLRSLARSYPHFQLYQFLTTDDVDLHAKMVVADRSRALIGSSNLSRRGLLTNHEIAVVLQGTPAHSASQAFDRLLTSHYVRSL